VVKQFATYTKYYGDLDATDDKAIATRNMVEIGLRDTLRKQIKHAGEKPRNYDIDMVDYQAFEDGNIDPDSAAGVQGAVYFPEPIFANSLPVVLVACKAYPKVVDGDAQRN